MRPRCLWFMSTSKYWWFNRSVSEHLQQEMSHQKVCSYSHTVHQDTPAITFNKKARSFMCQSRKRVSSLPPSSYHVWEIRQTHQISILWECNPHCSSRNFFIEETSTYRHHNINKRLPMITTYHRASCIASHLFHQIALLYPIWGFRLFKV